MSTLAKQVHKQWKDRNSEGISKWLFAGQFAASVGFSIYSIATGNWVFAVTNAALTLNNIVGIFLYFHFKKRSTSGAGQITPAKSGDLR